MSDGLGLPAFNQLQVEGFDLKLKAMLDRHLEAIDQCLKRNHVYTWSNLMHQLEVFDDELERFWSPFAHLHSVMDSKERRVTYEACLPLLSAYEAALGHNHALYKAIKSIDTKNLNAVQKKIIADALRDFELSGVALSAQDKKRFEAIQHRLSELSNQFQNNVLDATQAFSFHLKDALRLKGLPQHALLTAADLAKAQGLEGYVFNLEYPAYQAIITYAEDRDLRALFYEAYVTRASEVGPSANHFDNSPIMDELLALRHEKALLLGFDTYAHLSLATKMASSPDEVMHFMNDLVQRARGQAEEELTALADFARNELALDSIAPWDLPFVSERRRQALYALSQEDLRPYFPQPVVMQGLVEIIKRLYGMTLSEVKLVDQWHPDVACYLVTDQDDALRGYIYIDLYARPNKRGGAWMDSLQGRRILEGGAVQCPIATLTCNFAKPAKNRPALLSHDEVITLFHEFGHCLHHVLTQVDYLSVSGINGVEWDAVELPSQFFENWCWSYEALSLLTMHATREEKIPLTLFERLNESKNFQSAMAMLRQLEFALFDFKIHLNYKMAKPKFIAETLTEVRAQTALIPPVPYNRIPQSFSHIFSGGYAAGYYSYSYAEVLSSDAFARFEAEGIFNQKTGRDFLHAILEQGGSRTAAETYRQFRGRDATIDALLRHNGIKKINSKGVN